MVDLLTAYSESTESQIDPSGLLCGSLHVSGEKRLKNENVRLFRDGLGRCRRGAHAAVVQFNAGVYRRIHGWRERLWPGIIGPSVGALSVLSLLPFFQHFRDDSPYHLAGVAALQEAMPAELLQEDSDWFEAWRAAGIDEEVYVPYFKQTDNGPDGWRDCFASSAAMLAASAHLVGSDNEYIWHLSKFGDTTSVTLSSKRFGFWAWMWSSLRRAIRR